jgi:hypothetical protein
MNFVQLAVSTSNTPAVLLLCGAMALGLLFYTFYFSDDIADAPEKSRLAFLRERKETLYENLRDLNFEFKAGKFPESDYHQMRSALEEEAATLLAEIERLESGRPTEAGRATLRGKRSVLKGAQQ